MRSNEVALRLLEDGCLEIPKSGQEQKRGSLPTLLYMQPRQLCLTQIRCNCFSAGSYDCPPDIACNCLGNVNPKGGVDPVCGATRFERCKPRDPTEMNDLR
jgi:hypothetical protein